MKSILITLAFCLVTFFTFALAKSVLVLPFSSPGKISLEQLKKVKTLQFINELSKTDPMHYNFYSCIVTFIPAQGDPEEFSLNNSNVEKNKIWLHMLTKLSPNSKVFIEDIKGVGENGEIKGFGSVSFIIL